MRTGACRWPVAFPSGSDISVGSEGNLPQDFRSFMFSTNEGEN